MVDADRFRDGCPIGGSVGRDEVELAAYVVLAGIPLDKFLALDDPFEINMWNAIAARTIQLKQKLDENRAKMISNAVGKMLSGK